MSDLSKLTVLPFIGLLKTKADIPLCLIDLSVVANKTAPSDSKAFVIQAFVPFTTYELPLSLAIVEAAPASLPFPRKVFKFLQK